MIKKILILIWVLIVMGTASAASYSPSSTHIELIGMEENQTFEASEAGSHTFVWKVDGLTVQTDAGAGSSDFEYGPAPIGYDDVLVTIDGNNAHHWYVNNVVNMTLATASMQNLSSMDYNLSNYTNSFDTIWGTNDSKDFTENMLDKVSVPVTEFWATERGLGVWFWPVIIIIVSLVLFVKVDTIEITCIWLIIASATVMYTNTTLPEHIVYLLWAFTAVGFMGVLMSLFGGEE